MHWTWRTEEPADPCMLVIDTKKKKWLDHNGSSLDGSSRPARSRDKKVTKGIRIEKISFFASVPGAWRTMQHVKQTNSRSGTIKNHKSLHRYIVASTQM